MIRCKGLGCTLLPLLARAWDAVHFTVGGLAGVKGVTPALSDYYMLYDAADRRELRAEVPANKGNLLKDACLMHYSPVLGRGNSLCLRASEGKGSNAAVIVKLAISRRGRNDCTCVFVTNTSRANIILHPAENITQPILFNIEVNLKCWQP